MSRGESTGMSSPVRRLSIVVSGIVQGVGFRFFVRDTARRHSITGWVRNRPDGSVEMEAQGEPGKLSVFCEEACRGPVLSLIKKKTVVDIAALEGETSFDIRR